MRLGVRKPGMPHAAKVSALLSKSAVAVSTRLSAAVVLGLAALPLVTREAAPPTGDAAPVRAAAIAVAPAALGAAEEPAVEPLLQLAAQRSRLAYERAAPRRRPAHKTSAVSPAREAEHAGARTEDRKGAPPPKVSAIAPAETDARDKAGVPAAPSATEGEGEPPKPDVWSDAEVIAALRECVRLLAPIAADLEVSEPVKHERCGTPAPVLVRRVGSGANKVEISPPAVLNCAMVAGLHSFVEKTLQPAAQEALGTRIVRLRSASGYSCRNRNGSAFGADKLSEHARANAVDIAGFVTADGRTVDVARGWGPTARDLREAERVAAARAKGAPGSAEEAAPGKAQPSRAAREEEPARPKKVSAVSGEAPAAAKAGKKQSLQTAELSALGRGAHDARGADPRAAPPPAGAAGADAANTPEGDFLRRLHKGACGVFGTVLGPEANEAHRDHFHFDLAPRRHRAFCQ